ncbi:MAG: sulfite exporter TauE/SafE family protein [Phycisphaeraceae bacterium]
MLPMLLAQADTATWLDTLQAWLTSPWVAYPALVVAGFIAGVVNTIAGGGSFLTLPALIYLGGLDPKIANGTNRVAVLLSTASSTTVFHRAGHLDKRALLRMLLPTLIGVPPGALLAYYLPRETFQVVFGALFLAMAVFLALRPKSLLNPEKPLSRSRSAETVLFIGVGIYIGFLQAGMGVILLVCMSLFHARELIGANAIKNGIGLVVTIVAVAMFWMLDLIQWVPGLVMAMGNLIGGLVGARLAIHKGEKFIFGFVIVVMIATGAKLVWDALGG